MARKVGQIVRRGARTWLIRVYNGRDSETKKRKYSNHTVYGGLHQGPGSSEQRCSASETGDAIWTHRTSG